MYIIRIKKGWIICKIRIKWETKLKKNNNEPKLLQNVYYFSFPRHILLLKLSH